MLWNERDRRWDEYEWLERICWTMRQARDCLCEFGDGRPYDNNLEAQITRYYGKRTNPFIRGPEKEKDDPDIREKEWMRYAAYEIAEDIETVFSDVCDIRRKHNADSVPFSKNSW